MAMEQKTIQQQCSENIQEENLSEPRRSGTAFLRRRWISEGRLGPAQGGGAGNEK